MFSFGHVHHAWLEKKLNGGIWTEKDLKLFTELTLNTDIL